MSLIVVFKNLYQLKESNRGGSMCLFYFTPHEGVELIISNWSSNLRLNHCKYIRVKKQKTTTRAANFISSSEDEGSLIRELRPKKGKDHIATYDDVTTTITVPSMVSSLFHLC